MVTSTSFLIISLLFPIFVYFIYLVYSDLKNEREKDFVLDLVLLSSFYLTVIQSGISISNIILINIPVIISLIKRRHITSFLLIILILFKYCSYIPGANIIWLFSQYLIILIMVNIIKKNEVSIFFGVKFFSTIITSIILNSNNIKLDLIIKFVVMYFIFLAFKYIYLKLESIVSLRIALAKTIKDQKRFEDLFKIAHEVKNPLSVCKGYLQMLDMKDREKSNKYISIIKIQIDKTLEILKDFSSISNLKINKQNICLNLLLREISQEMSLFNTNYVNIETKIPSNKIFVDADFNRIKQVLLNVIKNAKESIEKTGKIKIDLYKKNNYAYIRIIDNGVGMDLETLNKLYTPFFTTKKNGTGLGVCLSKEIIEKHSGKIEYSSKINKGTKVIIKLPLKKTSS